MLRHLPVLLLLLPHLIDGQLEEFDEQSTTEARNYLREILRNIFKADVSAGGDSDEAGFGDQDDYDTRDMRNLGRTQFCEMVRNLHYINDTEYEYRPRYYYEYSCKSYNQRAHERNKNITIKYCYHPGGGCQPIMQEKIFFRRKKRQECWEPVSQLVSSGCNCKHTVEHSTQEFHNV